MVNSAKSMIYLTKSLLRLQLLKSKAKNNRFNNEKSYSMFTQQNNNRYFNCNNCESNELIFNKSNHMFMQGKKHLCQANLDKNIESGQDSTKVNENISIIYESPPPTSFINNPCPVDQPSEPKIEDIEIDDDSEFLNDKTLNKLKIPGPLEKCNEDLSYFAPYMQPTFNFAAYANQSETIQQLVKLGVELYKIERYPNSMKILLRRDFDEIKVYIQFLHDCGVHADDIGHCLTKFPRIVDEDLDDLHTRIRYLRAHKFSINDIQRIVSICPQWLGYTTKEVDRKLGYFQVELKLTGGEVRKAFITQPKLILASKSMLRENFFSFKEEMYFDEDQIKIILQNKPSIFINDRRLVTRTFDYVHNEMQISHDFLAKMPIILLTPVSKIAERHEFLKLLRRDQYDPQKPLYVNLEDLSRISDHEFCTNIAKTSIQLFDMFMKTR